MAEGGHRQVFCKVVRPDTSWATLPTAAVAVAFAVAIAVVVMESLARFLLLLCEVRKQSPELRMHVDVGRCIREVVSFVV